MIAFRHFELKAHRLLGLSETIYCERYSTGR